MMRIPHPPCKSSSQLISALKLYALLFLSQSHFVNAYIFIYAGCSQEKYQPNSPFQANLNSFFSAAVNSASQSSFNSFALGNTTPEAATEAAVYGLYQCRGDLEHSDCGSCIQSSVSQIVLVCPYSGGASLQLDGCYLRYEHADFLGKLDTSVVQKKCSKSVSDDVEFFRRRDDVLADLQRAIGFRVSSSGLVQGFAQCVGDLSSGDCSSCLSEAVSQLKNLCGSAAAAQVFLGKCYAQYWAAGYYDLNSPTDSGNEDDVGKTVAIIVGIVGGLAVFIVILSVCRKAMG
ncbi:hypothetical protein Nepgr_031681 [Nepenthes gracilis]|uniref:Gnk2-homologous domain-containing protein n=1 Tax=Nepenthes gracilis TaxID=150966 RepID=A0AAD3TH71_NEPGR|nr:hypothetical protein Nepgr_031681 [Nepenthes gracilis]